MKRKDIEIPKGVKTISIYLEKQQMTVLYEDETDGRIFECPETGDTEERPSVGDFCIFWNKGDRNGACCAHFDKMVADRYMSSEGIVYQEAIKFRNNEQYRNVRGIYEDEP